MNGIVIEHDSTAVRVAGHLAVDLVAEFGSPLHVVDERVLRGTTRRFLDLFGYAYQPTECHFSYKTNCLPALISVLHSEGLGAEVISPFELWLAEKLEVPGERIVINGTIKSEAYLRAAARRGPRLINIDALDEIEILARLAEELDTTLPVGARVVVPRCGWSGQLGLEPRDVVEVATRVVRLPRLDLCALQVHLGTNIGDPSLFSRAIAMLGRLSATLMRDFGIAVRTIDLGGGFGVPGVVPIGFRERAWTSLLGRLPPTLVRRKSAALEEHAQVIAAALERHFSRRALQRPTLLLEPGRALTGAAQVLLVTVRGLKHRTDGSRFALTDAGVMGAARPMSLEHHEIDLVSRIDAGPAFGYTLTGPSCTPADLLGVDRTLPRLLEGDILAVRSTGAYFVALECNFAFPRPAVVMVGQDGQPRLIRRREEHANMVARGV